MSTYNHQETLFVGTACKDCDSKLHLFKNNRLENFNCGSPRGNTPPDL